MVSEIVWEKFRTGAGFLEPLTVHFPDYAKGEWSEIRDDNTKKRD